MNREPAHSLLMWRLSRRLALHIRLQQGAFRLPLWRIWLHRLWCGPVEVVRTHRGTFAECRCGWPVRRDEGDPLWYRRCESVRPKKSAQRGA